VQFAPEDSEDVDMPGWLQQIQEGELEAEAMEEEEQLEAELSETLRAAVVEAEVEPEDHVELDIPPDEPSLVEDVLDEVWDDTLSTTEEPIVVVETEPEPEKASEQLEEPEEADIDEVEAALEREALDAVEIAELPKAAEGKLQMARQNAEAGNWSQALTIYEGMVGSSELLDKVIDDLEVNIRSHPEDTAIYQLLGDAYMKDGRLPSALKTYRKALAKLYQ